MIDISRKTKEINSHYSLLFYRNTQHVIKFLNRIELRMIEIITGTSDYYKKNDIRSLCLEYIFFLIVQNH